MEPEKTLNLNGIDTSLVWQVALSWAGNSKYLKSFYCNLSFFCLLRPLHSIRLRQISLKLKIGLKQGISKCEGCKFWVMGGIYQ